MCKPGNQTIYRECFGMLLKKGFQSNLEMREELRRHDGCMVYSLEERGKIDKPRELVLK